MIVISFVGLRMMTKIISYHYLFICSSNQKMKVMGYSSRISFTTRIPSCDGRKISTLLALSNDVNNENSKGSKSLNEVKSKINLIDVVESYNLKGFERTHTNVQAKANCPFHNDKTPSFFVTPKFYKCFGCGAGGDVFKFVKEMSSNELSYNEAIKETCNKFLDEVPSELLFQKEVTKSKEEMRLIEVNTAAFEYYKEKLLDVFNGGMARSYLIKRGLKPGTSLKFGLGYAPPSKKDNYQDLVLYFKKCGFTPQEIFDSGLVRKKTFLADSSVLDDYSVLYDRFENRLMIPILDVNHDVIGFGGRALDSQRQNAKYINSPESIIFHKRNILYGYDLFCNSKKDVVICEGYFDAIALIEAGIDAVSSMGTMLTIEQLKLVSFHQKVILCMDNDEAGQMSLRRICEKLIHSPQKSNKAMNFLWIMNLPLGIKDPWDFLAKNTPNDFLSLKEKALSWKEWYLDILLQSNQNNLQKSQKNY